MSTYKRLPRTKKKGLPFYRPIDRLMVFAWEKRKALVPFLIAVVAVAAILGGVQLYSSYYEGKATKAVLNGDLEKAVRGYPRSEAAKIARTRLGKRALDAKNYDEAIEWYAPLADDHAAPPILRIDALQNSALAHLKKGEETKAIELLEKAARDQNNRNQDYSQLLLAFARELSGQTEVAREAYKGLSEGASDSRIRGEAKEHLSWIESNQK